jgi:hypothetical protein
LVSCSEKLYEAGRRIYVIGSIDKGHDVAGIPCVLILFVNYQLFVESVMYVILFYVDFQVTLILAYHSKEGEYIKHIE